MVIIPVIIQLNSTQINLTKVSDDDVIVMSNDVIVISYDVIILGVKKSIEEYIFNFINSQMLFYEFPTSLFAQERKYIHQLCR